MRRSFSAILFTVFFSSLATAQPAETKPAPATPAGPTVKRTEAGTGLVIPDDQKKLGTPYYTISSDAKQVSFTSQALHATFDGHSSAVIGYAIAGPADSLNLLMAGAWALPVKSLDTGTKLRDKHIAGKDWLDAAANPDIIFTLKSLKDIKLHKESPAGKSYTATLVGDMTIHGVTRELSVPDAMLGFVAASDKAPAKGDLLAIRCKYTVKLTDYGIENKYITEFKSVADDIAIDQSLMLSTIPPEQQPAPKTEGEGK